MKKKKSIYRCTFAYVLLATVIFCGCEGNVKPTSTPYILEGGLGVKIFVIDSCEYIKIEAGNATWGSHKGNCKFCAERRTIANHTH